MQLTGGGRAWHWLVVHDFSLYQLPHMPAGIPLATLDDSPTILQARVTAERYVLIVASSGAAAAVTHLITILAASQLHFLANDHAVLYGRSQ